MRESGCDTVTITVSSSAGLEGSKSASKHKHTLSVSEILVLKFSHISKHIILNTVDK